MPASFAHDRSACAALAIERSGIQQAPWNIGLGRFRLVFLLLKPLRLGESHIPTFGLLLYRVGQEELARHRTYRPRLRQACGSPRWLFQHETMRLLFAYDIQSPPKVSSTKHGVATQNRYCRHAPRWGTLAQSEGFA